MSQASERALEKTAAWRGTNCVARFPNDPRNLRADAPHFSWDSETWRDVLNRTAKSVGFHHRAKDFNFFVKVLLQNLSSAAA